MVSKFIFKYSNKTVARNPNLKKNFSVSFGGIFSLFIGGSILSLFEIIYTCLIGAFGRFYMCIKAKRKKIMDSRTSPSEPRIYRTDFPPVMSQIFYSGDNLERRM